MKQAAYFFSQIIQSEQFNQYSRTESKFEIIALNAELLHGAAAFGDNVTREAFLVIDAVYINRFLIPPTQTEQM